MAFFRPNDPFVVSTPHFLGSKFEYSLTNSGIAESGNPYAGSLAFVMSNGKRTFFQGTTMRMFH